jgi:hypothetical protein
LIPANPVISGLMPFELSRYTTLVMAPLSGKTFDPQLALGGLVLAIGFAGLAMLVQR